MSAAAAMAKTPAIALILSLVVVGSAPGDERIFSRRSDWRTWRIPEGAIEVHNDGRLELGLYGVGVDPMEDMAEFEHKTKRSGVISGGVTAFSGRQSVRRLHDNDPTTWWQPNPADGIDKWWIHVDLGRVVLLEKIKLVFPDTAGARPFEDFSVYVSEGATVAPTEDVYSFFRVATTTRPNRERSLEYDLATIDPPSGGGSPATGENMVVGDSLRFRPVQYIRFVPHELTPDAALAELEVVAVGENISPGTFARGGGIRSSERMGDVAVMLDGTVDLAWNPSSSADGAFWQIAGTWFEWDIGATFWLNRIVIYSWPPAELSRTTFGTGGGSYGHDLSVSDGTPVATSDGFRSAIDYTRISLVNNVVGPKRWIFDHQFEPERARYLFWNTEFVPRSVGFLIYETFVYAEGHPAEASLESGFIPLGGARNLAKNITSISWEADLPPGTSLQVQSRTGEELTKGFRYYKKNGTPLSKEQYNKLPKAVLAPIEEFDMEGPDWSPWSEPHRTPGEAFRSPTPRQFLRLRVTLVADAPELTPVLRSLTVHFRDALVQKGIDAEVFPREAEVGEWQEFSYRLRIAFTSGDAGFDGLLIPVPSEVRDVSVLIRGREEADVGVETTADTMRLALPRRVLRDSLEVRFTARLLENPTWFAAKVTNSSQVDNPQEVRSAHRNALHVFLPAVSGSSALIGNLTLTSRIFTPNGDDVNDELQLTFNVLKGEVVPVVRVYDLSGRLVKSLAGRTGREQVFSWDGTAEGGNLAPPGMYVLRVEVDAQAATKTATRAVSLVY